VDVDVEKVKDGRKRRKEDLFSRHIKKTPQNQRESHSHRPQISDSTNICRENLFTEERKKDILGDILKKCEGLRKAC
jgi:hypothetical protein